MAICVSNVAAHAFNDGFKNPAASKQIHFPSLILASIEELTLAKVNIDRDRILTLKNFTDKQSFFIEEHEDYLHCDPDMIIVEEPKTTTAAVFRRMELPLCDELRRRTANLDTYQKEVANIVVKYD